MNIGAVARKTGLPAKTIRYYESIGLVRANRLPNGYRDYSEDQFRRLQFVARARALGFSLDECRRLLSFNMDRSRSCADAKELTVSHIDHVETQIEELSNIRSTLKGLVDACADDEQTECPILAYLDSDSPNGT